MDHMNYRPTLDNLDKYPSEDGEEEKELVMTANEFGSVEKIFVFDESKNN